MKLSMADKILNLIPMATSNAKTKCEISNPRALKIICISTSFHIE